MKDTAKSCLIEAQKSYIIEKYGDDMGYSSEYGWSEGDDVITTRICDVYGKFTGYITTWYENTEIKHHIH